MRNVQKEIFESRFATSLGQMKTSFKCNVLSDVQIFNKMYILVKLFVLLKLMTID